MRARLADGVTKPQRQVPPRIKVKFTEESIAFLLQFLISEEILESHCGWERESYDMTPGILNTLHRRLFS